MATLNFPDNPTQGQVFEKWTWNGVAWVYTPGGFGNTDPNLYEATFGGKIVLETP